MQEAKVSASNEAEISQNILRGSCCSGGSQIIRTLGHTQAFSRSKNNHLGLINSFFLSSLVDDLFFLLDESNDAVVKIRSAQLSPKALNHLKRDNQNTDGKHRRESWGCVWRCSRVAYVFGLKSSSLRCTLHTTNLRKDNTSIIIFLGNGNTFI